MRDPQYSTDPGVQLQLRELRARKEPMRIFPLGPGPIGTKFRVRSSSDREYEVEIRDPGARVNTCSCPDFKVNRLGTCKHIETIIRRARLAERARERKARTFVYLDPRSGRPAVFPPGAKGAAAPFVRAFFEDGGQFRGASPAELQRALEAAARYPARVLTVAPEVLHDLGRRREEEAWARWAESLRARARAGEDPFAFLAERLYPYQVDGALHLLERRRAILGDEMGLGKTVQAIAAATLLLREHQARRILVVCPASLKHQWDRELRRFVGRAPMLVEGTARERRARYAGAPFVVAHYEQIYRDRRFLRASEIAWDVVVLDEAQRIKNWRARTSDAVKDLRERCRFAFVLSGTPLENNLEELYSVCQFVDPSVLGPLWDFHDRYYRLDEAGRVLGYRNLAALRARLAPVCLRRTKEDVQPQLPERVVNRFYLALTPQQRAVHDVYAGQAAALLGSLRRRGLSEDDRRRLTQLLTLLRRACDASDMAKGEPGPVPKLDELERILDELVAHGGRKALVFSEWTDMLDRAAERLRKRRIGFACLHGGVPVPKRGELLDRFRDDPACRVLLSTDTGALGLDLQAAGVVIHLDLPWSPARLDQRNARAHRIGQSGTVQVVTLVAENSIESRIERLMESKRSLFDAVFREGAADSVDLPSSGMALALAEEVLAPVEPEGAAAGSGVGAPGTSGVAGTGAGKAEAGLREAQAGAAGAGVAAGHVAGTHAASGTRAQAGAGMRAGTPGAGEAGAGSAASGRSAGAIAQAVVDAMARPAATRAARALQAARHLRAGGFASEAVAQAGRAILATLGDLLARNGIPVPPDPQIPAAVRRHLVPAGRTPRALLDRALSSLLWSQGFEGEGDLPPELTDELLGEVTGIVDALGRG